MVKFVLFNVLACLVISLVAAKSLDGWNRGARIIQGFPAAINQFPHQAYLQTVDSNGEKFGCGGALISPRWVLTSASCVYKMVSVNVRLGSNRYESPQVQIESDDFIIFEEFNSFNLNNDIALVDLGAEVRQSDAIKPIRLPTASQVSELFVNRTVTVSGWGSTSGSTPSNSPTLNFVNMNVITNARCKEYFNPVFVIDSTICAVGFHSLSQGICGGDYGGPVILRESDDKDTLVGIVSRIHTGKCDDDYPSGFVRTSVFINWIAAKTGIEVRP